MEQVFWITGLSGAGKSTIARELYSKIKETHPQTVCLDGDELRAVFGGTHGHSMSERKELAMHYARLCRLLSEQGILVLCATVSMFDEVRAWNRKNIANYVEVFLRVDMEELHRRDQKQLYSGVNKGQAKNVIGVDIPMEEPKNPDFSFLNNTSEAIEPIVTQLYQHFLDRH